MIQERWRQLVADMGKGGREMVKVSVEKHGRITLLPPEKIIYCSYESGRVLVHTYDEVLPLYSITTMDRLAEHLADTACFFRAHRAVLVNLDRIDEFSPWFNGKYNLVMDDSKKSELTVSRSRVKEFRQRLGI